MHHLSRTRRAVVIVVGTLALAGAAAPIAAAMDNRGTVASGSTRATESDCSFYWEMYQWYINKQNYSEAKATRDHASNQGCVWAQSRTYSSSGTTSTTSATTNGGG